MLGIRSVGSLQILYRHLLTDGDADVFVGTEYRRLCRWVRAWGVG